jgi:hypothetical protein
MIIGRTPKIRHEVGLITIGKGPIMKSRLRGTVFAASVANDSLNVNALNLAVTITDGPRRWRGYPPIPLS